MRHHKQRLLHRPEEGQQGDCYRTALACLLDYDDPTAIPHFMDDPDEPPVETWRRVDEWLAEHHGLRHFELPLVPADRSAQEIMDWIGAMWPGLRVLFSGKSPRGYQHNIIIRDGCIEWDPHPDCSGVIEPGDDGYYWMGAFLPVAVHGARPAVTGGTDKRDAA